MSSLPPVLATIALGSNLADREGFLAFGLTALSSEIGPWTALSPWYETAPVGGPPQDPYLNAVGSLLTSLPPQELLALLLSIEDRAGRTRSVHWGPRTLDLDLLFYGDASLSLPASVLPDGRLLPALELPHPRLHLRSFVLQPLADIHPDHLHPTFRRTLRELLQACPDPNLGVPFRPSLHTQNSLAALLPFAPWRLTLENP